MIKSPAPTNQLTTAPLFTIIPDNRPNDYEYAVLSEHVYKNIKKGNLVKIKQEEWKIISTKSGKNDYLGALYKNESKRQLVLVHRGTKSFGGIVENLQTVILNLISAQQQAAYGFTKKAVMQSKNTNFHLSTTGHSLGALLAELSVYWCHDQFSYQDINAVTFESPGSRDLIEKRLLPNLIGNSIDIEKLDIIQYLSYPNLINTWGHHIGTVYQIQPMLGDLGWVVGWYTKQAHSISNIVKIFEEDILKIRVLMRDWPLGFERSKYFDQSIFQEGKYSLKELNTSKEFELYYSGHYVSAKAIDGKKQLLLKHFNPGVRNFLTKFFHLHEYLLTEDRNNKALIKYWQSNGVSDKLIDLILSYKIDKYRNVNMVTVLSGHNIYNWRNNLSLQLSQHIALIPKLLQPLRQDFIDQDKQASSSLSSQILSDLIIPIESVFLQRPDIIERMEENLKGAEGIQTIALVGIIGIGGAGKTTLARYYGKFKTDASVVFEVNAETKDTLINSFHHLAYILANTTEFKNELDFIKQIQNPAIQENLLLNFVKSCLKEKPSWVLIYDNIDSFSQIHHLFPHDTKQWGNGKVIITTRNEHVREIDYIKPENIIHITELSSNEMQTLFIKILYGVNPIQLSQVDYREVVDFLKNIPPFPLDVSVSAYSIKNTHVTFTQYLHHIKEYSKNYETLQNIILDEVNDYGKTRYGIISLAIEKLNKINPKFKELFFFICLLDSQNIQYELLEHYNNTTLVDDLVYHLRQEGLLLRESYSDFTNESKIISLHRSTQEVGAVFLINSLTEAERDYFFYNSLLAISSFYQVYTNNEYAKYIISLVPHLNALLISINKINIVPKNRNKYEIDLLLILGYVHNKWTKNLLEARNCFKKILEKINDCHLSQQTIATLLKNLGVICSTINFLEESLESCKKSIALCATLPDSEFIIADSLQAMGLSYRKTNNFTKARASFIKALKIISKTKIEAIKEMRAEIYSQLSLLYLTNYLNKKEAQIAERYSTKALKILSGLEIFHTQNKLLPPNISCQIARHRWKYSQVFAFYYGDYEAACYNLREAEYIMNNRCFENMHLKGRILGTLGEALLRTNSLSEAEQSLTDSINIIGTALGPNSTWIENINRAEARIRLGKYDTGYEDCLHVFEINMRERNNLHDLRYCTAFYHGAIAKYNLQDYHESYEHLVDFFKNINNFCAEFLEDKTYELLVTDKVFIINPHEETTLSEDIKFYLQHSLIIFTAIYGTNHPFIQDYIAIIIH